MKVLYMWFCVFCLCVFIFCLFISTDGRFENFHMILSIDDFFYSSLQYTSDAKCSFLCFHVLCLHFFFILIRVGSNVNSFLFFFQLILNRTQDLWVCALEGAAASRGYSRLLTLLWSTAAVISIFWRFSSFFLVRLD